MNRKKAIELILARYPEKSVEWAESQLARAEQNVDGEVVDYTEILEGAFDIG